MDAPVRCTHAYTQTVLGGMPLLVDLGRLQRAGDATLEAFIDSCLIGCSPHLFQLSTTDSYLYPLQLLISDQDETGLHSFWIQR